MDVAAPLVAAGADWIDTLVPIAVAVFWVVSQIVGVARRGAGDGGGRRRPGPEALPPARPGRPGGDDRQELERQIGEFLAKSRGDRTTGPAPGPPVRTARPAPRNRAGAARRPPAAPTAPPRPAPAQAPLASRRLEPLGAAGDDVEEHVRDAFSRELGHLQSPLAADEAEVRGAAPRRDTAEDLAATLRDREALRRLVVVREILERPVHRWD